MTVARWLRQVGSTILRDRSGSPCLWIARKRTGGLVVVDDGSSVEASPTVSRVSVATIARRWASAMDPMHTDADLWRQVRAVKP